jgi:large repetitive protein
LFSVVVNPSTGAYTLTLLDNVLHASGGEENDATAALTYQVSDSDGSVASGTLNITFDDDTPNAVAPVSITVINGASAPVVQSLDFDNNVANNYGADGGTVQFAPTLNSANSGLTSNFVPIIYTLVNGQTLVGKAGATTVFTITLNPATSQYTVDMDGKIDSTTTIDFNNGAYNFVGGNNSWSEFIPVAESVGAPIDNNSQDLLLTPSISGAPNGSINSTANTGGISSGASVGSTETFRVDFVTDLRGNPADGAGDYGTAANRDHVFDGHYTVNGASALFKSSSGSTVKITTFDDADGNNVVGDGVKDTINGITIAYFGVASTIIIPTTTATNYTVNGHVFTVTLNADGSVNVAGVAGDSGSSLLGTVIAVFTATGYNSVEYTYQSGDTFQIGDFGATTLTNNPVTFTVPVQVIDGDGDVSANSNLSITANSAPPIVLDLDGDGVEFVPLAAGVAFDYHGDGSADPTAWVGADDGLLAIDRNGDGIVNDGSEIVFGSGSLTDLQGLAANYDSNQDGQLTAADDNFALFGVWQDANSNGVTDAGEFRSLSDAGIVNIGLVSDGIAYAAAGGEVAVAGQSTYIKADGSMGIVADAAFATAASATSQARSSDQIRSGNLTTSIVAAALIGLVVGENPVAAHDNGNDMPGRVLSENTPVADSFEPVIITDPQDNLVQSAFTPSHDFVRSIGEVESSTRSIEDPDFFADIHDAPLSQMSELLADSTEPQTPNMASTAFAVGGDSVMHSMLDMAAFRPSIAGNDNPTIPMRQR